MKPKNEVLTSMITVFMIPEDISRRIGKLRRKIYQMTDEQVVDELSILFQNGELTEADMKTVSRKTAIRLQKEFENRIHNTKL